MHIRENGSDTFEYCRGKWVKRKSDEDKNFSGMWYMLRWEASASIVTLNCLINDMENWIARKGGKKRHWAINQRVRAYFLCATHAYKYKLICPRTGNKNSSGLSLDVTNEVMERLARSNRHETTITLLLSLERALFAIFNRINALSTARKEQSTGRMRRLCMKVFDFDKRSKNALKHEIIV